MVHKSGSTTSSSRTVKSGLWVVWGGAYAKEVRALWWNGKNGREMSPGWSFHQIMANPNRRSVVVYWGCGGKAKAKLMVEKWRLWVTNEAAKGTRKYAGQLAPPINLHITLHPFFMLYFLCDSWQNNWHDLSLNTFQSSGPICVHPRIQHFKEEYRYW